MRCTRQELKMSSGGLIHRRRLEVYLRDDIHCGFVECSLCVSPAPGVPAPSLTFQRPELLIVDEHVARRQYDVCTRLLQLPSVNLVLLQSVLGHVKSVRFRDAARWRQFLRERERPGYVFSNEHHTQTHVARSAKESVQHRGRRAMYFAAEWYARHISRSGVQVVVLVEHADRFADSMDDENTSAVPPLLCAAPAKVKVQTVWEYVKGKQDALPDLPAFLAAPVPRESSETAAGSLGRPLYPAHYSLSRLLREVSNGRLCFGAFKVGRDFWDEAVVTPRAASSLLRHVNLSQVDLGGVTGEGSDRSPSGRTVQTQTQKQTQTQTPKQTQTQKQEGSAPMQHSGGARQTTGSSPYHQDTQLTASHQDTPGDDVPWCRGTLTEGVRVCIRGLQHMNRACHGDLVVVELLPRAAWDGVESAGGIAPVQQEVDDGRDGVTAGGSQEAGNGVEDGGNASAQGGTGNSGSAGGTGNSGSAGGTGNSGSAGGTGNSGSAGGNSGSTGGNSGSTGGNSGSTGGGGSGGQDTQDSKTARPTPPLRPSGRVVGIITREVRDLCGSFMESDRASGVMTFVPVDRRMPKMRVHTSQARELMDKRIMCRMDLWPRDSRYPQGHYVRTMGVIGDRNTETEVILHEHQVRMTPWTVNIMKELPPADYQISSQEVEGRLDLRECKEPWVTHNGARIFTDINICSIDPPGCTDIDDCLHVADIGGGKFQVGVHIADVSHYVRPGSCIDQEAAQRGTTVYLVDRRIHMLPGRLSTNICSLQSKVDRLAFSVIWTMNRQANVEHVSFHKTVIRSKASLTYNMAQSLMEAYENDQLTADTPHEQKGIVNTDMRGFPITPFPIARSVSQLMALARHIKAKRFETGALTLASAEVKFKLNKETSEPVEMGVYTSLDVNSLVEEFMVAANIAVGKHVLSRFPTLALLRRHPAPTPDMLASLLHLSDTLGLGIKAGSGKELQASLARCQRTGDPFFNKLVRMLTTRCMAQAVYFSSGEHPFAQYRHYGLGSDVYTHFTSPIRRYADLVVHRLLATALAIDPLPGDVQNRQLMTALTDTLNHKKRMAELASRASADLFLRLYFRGKGVVRCTGLVTQVRRNAIRVHIPEFGMDQMVKLLNVQTDDAEEANLTNPFLHDSRAMTLSLSGKALNYVFVRAADQADVSERKRMQLPDSLCFNMLDRLPLKVYVRVTASRREYLVTECDYQTLFQTQSHPSHV